MAIQTEVARDKLIADFNAVINDTEELLRATAGQTGERVTAVRTRLEGRLARTKENLTELSEDAIARGKATARSADAYVRERPWQSIGIAAAVGLVVGLFARRE